MPFSPKSPFPRANILLKESGQIFAPFKRLFPSARLDITAPLFHAREINRSMGGSLNEAILKRRPFYNPDLALLVVPLLMEERVAGLLTAQGVEEEPSEGMADALLEMGSLALERIALRSLYFDPPGSGLYRHGPFNDEINRAMTLKGLGDYFGRGSFSGFALVAAGPMEVSQAAAAAEILPQGGIARLKGRTILALLPTVQVEGAASWLQALSDELGAAAFAAGIAFYPTDLLAEADAGGSSGPAAEDIIARAEFALKSARARGAGVYLTFEEASEIIPGAPKRSRFVEEAEPMLSGTESFAVLMARVEELREELAGLDRERIEEVLAAYGSLAESLLPGAKVVAPWSWDTLGVLLDGADEAGARESAALLKQTAQKELGSTLTLGIAVYPFRDFEARDVPLNAARALTHAGFFGPGAIQPFDAVSLNIAGDRLLAVGDEAGAIELFDLALTLNPEEINVLNSLGALFGRRGEYEKARSFFEKAAAAGPEDFMAAYNLGSVNLALGEREGALNSFIDAARIDPGRGEPLLMAGRLLVEEGRHEEAKDFLKRAWDTGLRESLLDRLLGEALVAAGDAAEGRLHLMRALRDDPDDPGGLKVLARSYIEDEREADLAVSLLERARELAPEDPEIKELIDKARNLGDDTASRVREREG